jgi:hypothetical protein
LRSGKNEASDENQPQQLRADAKEKRAKKQSCLQRKTNTVRQKRNTTAGKSGMEEQWWHSNNNNSSLQNYKNCKLGMVLQKPKT